MAKYRMRARETFETVIPESNIVWHTIHGTEVSQDTLPERKITTLKGSMYTARNKPERDKMLASGKWEQI